MATGTGIDAQIGYFVESTWATAGVVTRFHPLVSETLSDAIDRVESAAQFAGRQVLTSQQWAPGNKTISGDIAHEMYDQDMGFLFQAAFGTVSTAGAGGTGTHTFFPASPVVSLTAQIGRPTIYGSVIPFTYQGLKIQKWEFAAKAGEIPTWGMTVVGQEETMGTSLAASSYTSNARPWQFQTMTFSVLGTTTTVKDFKLAGDNMLDDARRFLGSTVIAEPLRKDLAAYTGDMTLEWGNPSGRGTLNYLAYLGGTEGTLVATMASGTLMGTITANVRFDGTTPNVSGRGIVEHPIPFKAVASGSLDQHAIKVILVNNQTTA